MSNGSVGVLSMAERVLLCVPINVDTRSCDALEALTLSLQLLLLADTEGVADIKALQQRRPG